MEGQTNENKSFYSDRIARCDIGHITANGDIDAGLGYGKAAGQNRFMP